MRKKLLFSLWALVLSFALYAQTTVNGKVTDANGAPLAGVTVREKGNAKNVVATSTDGAFTIVVKNGARLIFTSVGFQELEVAAADAKAVRMTAESETLEDVVVTGVAQATSKKKLSFSLTTVKGSDINVVPQLDASQSLRGRVAGIQINQSQGNQGATVFLRGAKSVFGNIAPLIVVDGFQTSLTLSDLNPEDIETIEVVKGAAASSLYGTRAEGGVIQVITKKGKNAKGRPNIVVDGEWGFNNIQRIPELTKFHPFKVNNDGSFVLNGFQRSLNYASNGYSLVLSPYQNYYDNTKALLDNRPFTNYTASISNATGPFNYYVSFQNQKRGGAVNPVGADIRNTFKVNAGYKPYNNLETNVTFQYIDFNRPSDFISRNTQGTLFAATLQYEPFINLLEKNPDGSYKAKPTGFEIQNANLYNPLYEWSQRQVSSLTTNLLIGADARWKFAKGFDMFVSGSVNTEYGNSTNYYPLGYQTVTANPTLNNGFYGEGNFKNDFKNFNAQLSYNGRSKDFEYGGSLKYIFEEYSFTSTNASGYNMSAPVKDLSATDPTTRSISSGWNKTINKGYFANGRLGYKNKIFLDVLARIDQSSRYGRDVQSALFPRASVAYRVTQDVSLGFVNELKVRAAWGRAGSLPGFNAKNSIASITSTGISIQQLENTNLERSYTDELEVGIEGQMFNKINYNITYADAKSVGDFVRPPSFTPFFGSSSIVRNLGDVKSYSVEAEFNGDVVKRKNFSINTGLTFTLVRSRILDLGGIPDFSVGTEASAPLFRKSVGLSAFGFWGKKVLRSLDQLQLDQNGRVINVPGGLSPNDFAINNMGFVVQRSLMGTANERPIFFVDPETGGTTFLGRGEADFQIGIPTNINIGNKLNIFFLLDWKQGGLKYNQTRQYLTFDNRTKVWEDFARAGLPIQFLQQVYNGNQITDYWLEKNSFVAFRELSLAYNVSNKQLGKLGKFVQSARVALIGRNLFYFTDYQGVNPEGYWEYYPYPVYRTMSAKITFNLY